LNLNFPIHKRFYGTPAVGGLEGKRDDGRWQVPINQIAHQMRWREWIQRWEWNQRLIL